MGFFSSQSTDSCVSVWVDSKGTVLEGTVTEIERRDVVWGAVTALSPSTFDLIGVRKGLLKGLCNVLVAAFRRRRFALGGGKVAELSALRSAMTLFLVVYALNSGVALDFVD